VGSFADSIVMSVAT